MTIRELAKSSYASAVQAGLDPAHQRVIRGDLDAGEWEAAMIGLLELAPQFVAQESVELLEDLVSEFDTIDARLARMMIDRYRELEPT